MKNKKIFEIIFITLGLSISTLICFIKIIPEFKYSYSFVLYSKENKFLGARVSKDEQWRFPPIKNINKKYKNALITYEDKNFYFHSGIDPLAIIRASIINLKNKKIVSGASTITMQVARISEESNNRTIIQKIKESIISCFLEIAYSKKNILKLYTIDAPYGGNVRGIEAASWRYFLRDSKNLTWAEVATLAVLPNQPRLIMPGKNSTRLKEKRNKLLKTLFKENNIKEENFLLALEEAIPNKPKILPDLAPHYLELLKAKTNQQYSSIDYNLQNLIYKISEKKFKEFCTQKIYNTAVIVMDTNNGDIISYIGNCGLHYKLGKNQLVDMINAKRSTGSLLKPFLFAAMLDAGLLLPEQLMIDIPTQIGSYNPENNTHRYYGAIPANKALAHSLNVPFVRALKKFTISSFLDLLKRMKLTTFMRTANEYGLPLILGGAETTLYEITNAYRLLMLQSESKDFSILPFSAGAARTTLDILSEANRPEEEEIWQLYSNGQKIAWKTGTSYGNKDAWSIGVTNKFTVGVWCGNATGEGRPEITSTKLAAPILFEVFSILPKSNWTELNKLDFEYINTCIHSGYLASKFCSKIKKTLKPKNAKIEKACPYCKPISFTPDKKFQAKSSDIKQLPKIENRFVLPASIEYFYMQVNPEYIPLPPWIPNSKNASIDDFEITFPEKNSNIFIPIELTGKKGAIIAKASHKNSKAIIYWDLDGKYLGKTENYHQIKIQTKKGRHSLTATDDKGQIRIITFKVINKTK